jgi:hypothetical protein
MTKKIARRLSQAAVLWALALSCCRAQVINAASCNQSDVQNAFNQVTASTTTINIPAGTCTWTSQAVLNVPSTSSNLSVVGATTCTGSGAPSQNNLACTDNTIIIDNDTTDSNYLIQLNTGQASSQFRFTGITLEAGSGAIKDNGALAVHGYSQNVRLDHLHLIGSSTSTGEWLLLIRLAGWMYGVVDHVLSYGDNGIQVWDDNYGNTNGAGTGLLYQDAGDGSWADVSHLGGFQAIFIENNSWTFPSWVKSGGSINDCYSGGRQVIRYNTITYGSTQTHPTGGTGRARGCRTTEIYGNSFLGISGSTSYNVFYDSSGVSVIWGNQAVAQAFSNFVTLHNELQNTATYKQTATPNGWGYCGSGSGLSGDDSAWDEGGSSASGTPCLDQPGRGQTDQLEGQFPNTCDYATGCTTYNGTWPHQLLEPVYEWEDTWTPISGQASTNFSIAGETSGVTALVENQDYYGQCGPLSATCTGSFSGKMGTGFGPLASRPSTCTAGPSGTQFAGPYGNPGVAYWATDQGNWNQSGNGGQGELFVCTAANTWTLYYTPYTYPHPLDNSQSPTSPGSTLTGQVVPAS